MNPLILQSSCFNLVLIELVTKASGIASPDLIAFQRSLPSFVPLLISLLIIDITCTNLYFSATYSAYELLPDPGGP